MNLDKQRSFDHSPKAGGSVIKGNSERYEDLLQTYRADPEIFQINRLETPKSGARAKNVGFYNSFRTQLPLQSQSRINGNHASMWSRVSSVGSANNLCQFRKLLNFGLQSLVLKSFLILLQFKPN